MAEKKKPLEGTAEMKEYFSSLPTYIKESIEQSGIKFTSKAELSDFVNNLRNN